MSAPEPTEPAPGGRREFLDGARRGVPVVLAVLPFALLFGAVAVQNGFTVFEATLMSTLLFAGASQLVGLELFGQNIAPWLVVLSIFAVNFRHVLYSAALGRLVSRWTPAQFAFAAFFLTDAQYAESERKARGGVLPFVWYMGLAAPLYGSWVLLSAVGAAFGNLIANPHALGLDFLLPIYFFGLVLDFRRRPLFLPVVGASAVASVAAFYLVGSPWHVSIGAVAGVALAAALPGKWTRTR